MRHCCWRRKQCVSREKMDSRTVVQRGPDTLGIAGDSQTSCQRHELTQCVFMGRRPTRGDGRGIVVPRRGTEEAGPFTEDSRGPGDARAARSHPRHPPDGEAAVGVEAPRVGKAPGSSKRVGYPAPVVSLKPGSLVNWLSTARPSASGPSDCENSPHGFATLRRRPKPGRPPRLTPQQWQVLLDILQRGGDAVRFPDRELDPVEGSCRNRAPLRSDLPCEFLLGPTEAVGLDGTGVPAVRARERDEELIRA